MPTRIFLWAARCVGNLAATTSRPGTQAAAALAAAGVPNAIGDTAGSAGKAAMVPHSCAKGASLVPARLYPRLIPLC